MNEDELLEASEIKRMHLKDGDVLAVYVPRDITDYEADYMERRLKALTGLDVRVFVLPPGHDVKVISREEAGE